MNTNHTQPELIDEITRYLATVELFRSLGCEPSWRPESVGPVLITDLLRSSELARRAH